MPRRSPLSLSSALCVSLFTTASLLAACSSEDTPDDDAAAGKGGSSGSSAGTTAKGGSSGSSGTTSGTTGGGTGGASAGTGGSAGSKAGGGGTGGSTTGGTGGASAGTGGSTTGGTGGASAGTGGSTGGTGGALGGAGSGGASGGGGAGGGGGTAGGGSGVFTLTSPAFDNVEGCSSENRDPCEAFPVANMQYMGGGNQSPELNWTGVPAGTMGFAVVLQDLTFPNIHWAIWKIAGSATGLPANVEKVAAPAMPAGAQQTNFQSMPGYFGPGSSCNAYQFIVYALATSSFAPTPSTTAENVMDALEALDDDVLLGRATLTGRANYMNMCQ